VGTKLSEMQAVPQISFGLAWWRKLSSLDDRNSGGPKGALRKAFAREQNLIREIDWLIEEQKTLRTESDHRLLNGLQIVISMLMLQSRAAPTSDLASQLSSAANRVAAIERIHRRLHFNDGTQAVAFKNYMEELCAEFYGVADGNNVASPGVAVQCDDISLPTTIAIPLGFIINELVTNAIKHGEGRVEARLKGQPGKGCTLTVSNDGPALPDGFDPATSTGLGMKVVQSFTRQIGGEFSFERGAENRGARFIVRFI